jgi:hypothetical protein
MDISSILFLFHSPNIKAYKANSKYGHISLFWDISFDSDAPCKPDKKFQLNLLNRISRGQHRSNLEFHWHHRNSKYSHFSCHTKFRRCLKCLLNHHHRIPRLFIFALSYTLHPAKHF